MNGKLFRGAFFGRVGERKLGVHPFDESSNFSLLISRGCDAYRVGRKCIRTLGGKLPMFQIVVTLRGKKKIFVTTATIYYIYYLFWTTVFSLFRILFVNSG